MIMLRKIVRCLFYGLPILFSFHHAVFAGEQGHYSPMPLSIRDTVMPEKGLYFVMYNIYYSSDSYQDENGHTLDLLSGARSATASISLPGNSIPITISGNLAVNLDLKLQVYNQTLPLMWVPGIQILGADYACLIAPSWGYTRIEAEANSTGSGDISIGRINRSFSSSRRIKVTDENTGFGDLLVQPIWLSWRGKRYDLGVSYGLYCPTGAYDERDLANVGMGFLTQMVQLAGYFYPFENKATAFMLRPTYEWHSKKIDKDSQPGQNITLEYGISQYLHPQFEIAASGYQQWQVSDDHGSESPAVNCKDRVGGFGAQATFWVVEQKCAFVGKFNHEYSAKDRFQGNSWALNLTWIF